MFNRANIDYTYENYRNVKYDDDVVKKYLTKEISKEILIIDFPDFPESLMSVMGCPIHMVPIEILLSIFEEFPRTTNILRMVCFDWSLLLKPNKIKGKYLKIIQSGYLEWNRRYVCKNMQLGDLVKLIVLDYPHKSIKSGSDILRVIVEYGCINNLKYLCERNNTSTFYGFKKFNVLISWHKEFAELVINIFGLLSVVDWVFDNSKSVFDKYKNTADWNSYFKNKVSCELYNYLKLNIPYFGRNNSRGIYENYIKCVDTDRKIILRKRGDEAIKIIKYTEDNNKLHLIEDVDAHAIIQSRSMNLLIKFEHKFIDSMGKGMWSIINLEQMLYLVPKVYGLGDSVMSRIEWFSRAGKVEWLKCLTPIWPRAQRLIVKYDFVELVDLIDDTHLDKYSASKIKKHLNF